MKTEFQIRDLVTRLEQQQASGAYKLHLAVFKLKLDLLYWVLAEDAQPASRGKIIQYAHHNWLVSVDEGLKGKHQEHCLCFKCDRFAPNQKHNCAIAQAVFETCVKFGLTTPVYECPYFAPGEPDLSNIAEETF